MAKRISIIICFLIVGNLSFAQSWYSIGSGINKQVYTLDSLNGKLYVGGYFDTAGGIWARNIAVWNGNSWDSLSNGMSTKAGGDTSSVVWVQALQNYNGNLYAAGSFLNAGHKRVNYIAEWDGTAWQPLGTGVRGNSSGPGYVNALTVYKGKLIAAGDFDSASGIPVNYVAAWDGSNWTPLGTGLTCATYALTVYNGKLIAGCYYTKMFKNTLRSVNVWNDTTWAPLGNPPDSMVYALQVYNGNLYAGGVFDSAGGLYVSNIAQWNGTAWSGVGAGVNNIVEGFGTYNDNLIVGGFFTVAGGNSVNYLASWNGSTWSTMGSNFNLDCDAFTNFDGMLIAGGIFSTPERGVAEWGATAGVNEIKGIGEKIKIYPNPASTILNIETYLTQGEVQHIYLYNEVGQEVKCTKTTSSFTTIEVSDLAMGLYMYRVTDSNGEMLGSGKVSIVH